MVKVGQEMKCPDCEQWGRVVWISEDRKKMGIECPSHKIIRKPLSKFAIDKKITTEIKKNVVIITDIIEE